MLGDLTETHKFVHDLSGVEIDPWAKQLSALSSADESFDFALNCQVLEHVNNHLATLAQIVALTRLGG